MNAKLLTKRAKVLQNHNKKGMNFDYIEKKMSLVQVNISNILKPCGGTFEFQMLVKHYHKYKRHYCLL